MTKHMTRGTNTINIPAADSNTKVYYDTLQRDEECKDNLKDPNEEVRNDSATCSMAPENHHTEKVESFCNENNSNGLKEGTKVKEMAENVCKPPELLTEVYIDFAQEQNDLKETLMKSRNLDLPNIASSPFIMASEPHQLPLLSQEDMVAIDQPVTQEINSNNERSLPTDTDVNELEAMNQTIPPPPPLPLLHTTLDPSHLVESQQEDINASLHQVLTQNNTAAYIPPPPPPMPGNSSNVPQQVAVPKQDNVVTSARQVLTQNIAATSIPPPPPPPMLENLNATLLQPKIQNAPKLKQNADVLRQSSDTKPVHIDFNQQLTQMFRSKSNDEYAEVEVFYRANIDCIKKLRQQYTTPLQYFSVSTAHRELHEFLLLLLVYKDMFDSLPNTNDSYDVMDHIVSFVSDYKGHPDQKNIGISEICKSIIEFAHNHDLNDKYENIQNENSNARAIPVRQRSIIEATRDSVDKFLGNSSEWSSPGKAIQSKFGFNKQFKGDIVDLYTELFGNILPEAISSTERLTKIFPYLNKGQTSKTDAGRTSNKSNKHLYPFFSVDMSDKRIASFDKVMDYCQSNTSYNTSDTSSDCHDNIITIDSGAFVTFVVDRSNKDNKSRTTETTNQNDSSIYLPFPIYATYKDQHFILQAALTLQSTRHAKNSKIPRTYKFYTFNETEFIAYERNEMVAKGFKPSLKDLQHNGVLFVYRAINIEETK